MVENYGGLINVDSKLNEGVKFFIVLPELSKNWKGK
jgi:signal transduction histidine kinase